jgi:Flp pilus assembly protein TadD
VATTGRSAKPGLSPIENYKQQQIADALRGLNYGTGFVEIDEQTAPEIAERGTVEEATDESDRGAQLLVENHILDAIKAFTRAVIIAPDEPQMYVRLGGGLVNKGLTDEAEAAYRTALELDPESVEARFLLGQAFQLTGRMDEAIEAWYEVLDRSPDHTGAHYHLAISQYYTNDYAAAWEHVHRAEALGQTLPSQFRPLLEAKMSEPKG